MLLLIKNFCLKEAIVYSQNRKSGKCFTKALSFCSSKSNYRSHALKSRSKLRAAIGLRVSLENFLLHWNSSLFTVNFGEKVLTLAKGHGKLNRKMVIVCQLMIQLIIALTGFARVIWYGLTSRNSPNYFYQCMLNIS